MECTHDWLGLLVGPHGLFGVLILWILVQEWNLYRSHRRNDELASLYIQSTEMHWRERARREETHMLLHDSSHRSTLGSLESVLKAILVELQGSSGK